MAHLDGKNILLGVTGGIAAYKAPDLVRRLRERGATVQVVMSEGAQAFVTPLTFEAVSHRPVRTHLWDRDAEMTMGHIELARWADRIVIAPATADCIARLTQGRADDLLSTICLATEAPITLCPAMNPVMWRHPATQANVNTLRERGVAFIGPADGAMAENESGTGRLVEPTEIAAELDRGGPGLLAGKTVLITAGPTREAVDPVRYLSNRSSGRMGFAIAEAAARAGAKVLLVSGPVSLSTPPGVERVDVESARQMQEAVMTLAPNADVFIAAAAVADYRPAETAERKLKKDSGDELAGMKLVENPDILAGVAAMKKDRPFTVGFAAETNDVEANARKKLEKKQLDLIAANQVGADRGFDRDDNELLLLDAKGSTPLGAGSKRELAGKLLAVIADRIQ
ncbi:bifunctional phosphopantothenoylcysteine decarboxylase/phosphopantothenate--cysteine ligase CoaBC [Natronospira bacteriovora]|uniref:Coenzyme A biosynthesis bifunctional protein CoaBC n=1 Tax=Natronospira bacteriovora TaxID=3069753 RepID=A0ABU0W7Y3_9GAMM|nr:bifunctional phosphopantothenoylcysteine decarboxylase/phosphopantothenate--cysteine ligase CoaBC [Natronospira sp. AB-CW4]MDQ2070101.1 bifunctional phosphopantothenoylcysteine decarboxylase/phosphopantothenate--cysteine ligase CoaBC [Natronospira sp. AB-CW4]